MICVFSIAILPERERLYFDPSTVSILRISLSRICLSPP